jgi:hypothetical protein
VWPRPWSEPFRLSESGGVERVRILALGLTDGSVRSLFEGDLAEVEDYFAEHGRHRIVEIGPAGVAQIDEPPRGQSR